MTLYGKKSVVTTISLKKNNNNKLKAFSFFENWMQRYISKYVPSEEKIANLCYVAPWVWSIVFFNYFLMLPHTSTFLHRPYLTSSFCPLYWTRGHSTRGKIKLEKTKGKESFSQLLSFKSLGFPENKKDGVINNIFGRMAPE